MVSCVPGQESTELADSVWPDILCWGGDKELSQKLDFIGQNLIHSAEMEMLTAFLIIRCYISSANSNYGYFFKIKP